MASPPHVFDVAHGGHRISSLSFRMFMLVFPVCHVLNYEYAENNKKQQQHNVQPQWIISWCYTLTACPVSQPPTLSLSLFVLLLRGCVINGAWYTLWPEQECCKMPPQNMPIWHGDEEWGVVSQYKSWKLTACLSVLYMFVYMLAQSLSFCSERFFIWGFSFNAACSFKNIIRCSCWQFLFPPCFLHSLWFPLEAKIRSRERARVTIFRLNL